jgi:hypothetical protein
MLKKMRRNHMEQLPNESGNIPFIFPVAVINNRIAECQCLWELLPGLNDASAGSAG